MSDAHDVHLLVWRECAVTDFLRAYLYEHVLILFNNSLFVGPFNGSLLVFEVHY